MDDFPNKTYIEIGFPTFDYWRAPPKRQGQKNPRFPVLLGCNMRLKTQITHICWLQPAIRLKNLMIQTLQDETIWWVDPASKSNRFSDLVLSADFRR